MVLAWYGKAVFNECMEELIAHMIRTGVIKTPLIIDAFRAIDRADFVPSYYRSLAYEDRPLPIGYDQTISQPSTVARMLELLMPQPNDRVLDIGSGSGWTTALLAYIVGSRGSVLGLERIEELVTMGRENIARYPLSHAHVERAHVELGAPQDTPFDRILASAAARSFPKELVSQLVEYGTMVVPVKDALWRAVRVEHQPIIERFEGYIFVPLIVK